MQRWSHRRRAGLIASVALSLGIAVRVLHVQASTGPADRLSGQARFLYPLKQSPLGSEIPDRKRLLSITVDFDMGPGDEGLLFVVGNESEVFKLYVKNGSLVWTHDYVLRESIIAISSDYLPTGLINALQIRLRGRIRCEPDWRRKTDREWQISEPNTPK